MGKTAKFSPFANIYCNKKLVQKWQYEATLIHRTLKLKNIL